MRPSLPTILLAASERGCSRCPAGRMQAAQWVDCLDKASVHYGL